MDVRLSSSSFLYKKVYITTKKQFYILIENETYFLRVYVVCFTIKLTKNKKKLKKHR